MTMKSHQADKAEPRNGAQPTKWWQWILVYPGIVLGLLGAVPTAKEVVKSYQFDTTFGNSHDAEYQSRLWAKNSGCLRNAVFTPIKTEHSVEISTLICKSGDVLLIGKRPEWDMPQQRWVAWSDIAQDRNDKAPKIGSLFELIPTAVAAEPKRTELAQSGPSKVMCQRPMGSGRLLQRIGTPQGCFDQVINTFNGWVVSSKPAACVAQC
jgi:hypothetical protein